MAWHCLGQAAQDIHFRFREERTRTAKWLGAGGGHGEVVTAN